MGRCPQGGSQCGHLLGGGQQAGQVRSLLFSRLRSLGRVDDVLCRHPQRSFLLLWRTVLGPILRPAARAPARHDTIAVAMHSPGRRSVSGHTRI